LATLAVDARRILVGITGLVTLIGLLAPEILVVAGGGRYIDALPAVGVSLVGVFGSGAYLVASMPSALARRMGDLGFASAVGVVVSLAVNAVLARPLGATGTAMALAVGPLLSAVLVYTLGSRYMALPMKWLPLLPVLAVLIAATMLVTLPPGGLPREVRILIALLAIGVLVGEGTLLEAVNYFRRRWIG
jgi:hypothetical protein